MTAAVAMAVAEAGAVIVPLTGIATLVDRSSVIVSIESGVGATSCYRPATWARLPAYAVDAALRFLLVARTCSRYCVFSWATFVNFE